MRADEFRARLSEARATLAATISRSEQEWELGTEAKWGPRKIVEHVITDENYFANAVAAALQANGLEQKDIEAVEPQHALQLLEEMTVATDRIYGYIEDGDIDKVADIPAGQGFEQTIGGTVDFAVWHLLDHSKQISEYLNTK